MRVLKHDIVTLQLPNSNDNNNNNNNNNNDNININQNELLVQKYESYQQIQYLFLFDDWYLLYIDLTTIINITTTPSSIIIIKTKNKITIIPQLLESHIPLPVGGPKNNNNNNNNNNND